jgi:U3 small nucleolar RNA-associated protein 14
LITPCATIHPLSHGGQPATELETCIDKPLKSAQPCDESDIQFTNYLWLSVENVPLRRAELCWIRELIFRAEAIAKRVAKIKGKMYLWLKKNLEVYRGRGRASDRAAERRPHRGRFHQRGGIVTVAIMIQSRIRRKVR